MENNCLEPLIFNPVFRSVRWGGSRLAQFKGISELPESNIGESWEISGIKGNESKVAKGPFTGATLSQMLQQHGTRIMGERLYKKYGNFFPLLIKFIDAEDDLSIQVHPGDDNSPEGFGKTELWYILKTEPGSYIYSGFNRNLDRQSLTKAMSDGKLVDVLAKHFSAPGDVFYLPSGRIHSIGAGNLLLEVQQASEITYRLHDYNRTDRNGQHRTLHVSQALDVIDYSQTDFGLARPQMLIDCETRIKTTPYFIVTAIQVMDTVRLDIAATDSPRILVAISGAGEIINNAGHKQSLRCGQSVLIPAETEYVQIHAVSTPFRIISTFIP